MRAYGLKRERDWTELVIKLNHDGKLMSKDAYSVDTTRKRFKTFGLNARFV